MNVERFAGDNSHIKQMADDLERQRLLDKQRLAEFKRSSDEQIRRDVAATQGIIIPFS